MQGLAERKGTMFRIQVREEFEAAHRIVGYPGKCDRLHGHSWSVEAKVAGKTLDDLGMLVDFKVIKRELKTALDRLDHRYLNEMPPFCDGVNPTAEHLAKYFYEELAAGDIFPPGVMLESVCVWESPHSCAIYEPDGK